MDPNLTSLPEETELHIVEIKKGLYVATNAYEGDYEYFEGERITIEEETIPPSNGDQPLSESTQEETGEQAEDKA
jgi:hypothetical protein